MKHPRMEQTRQGPERHRLPAHSSRSPATSVTTVRTPIGTCRTLVAWSRRLGRWFERGRLVASRDIARMREQAALLQTTLDNMDQGLVMVAPDGTVPVCNQRAIDLLDLPPDMMGSRPLFSHVLKHQMAQDDFKKSEEPLRRWFGSPAVELTQHTYERERPNGTCLEIRSLPSPGGGMVRTYTDITDRKRAEDALRKAELEYRSLFENAVVGIYCAKADGTKVRANPALVRLNGYESEQELLASQTSPNISYVDLGRFGELMRLLRENGRVDDFVSEVFRHDSGQRMWISETAWVVATTGDEAPSFEGTVVDATERKLAEARIEHVAKHDPLTGLPNRVLFRERLNAELAGAGPSQEPLALLCLDLDRFKTVNDSLGHLAGDALLQTVAARIAAAVGSDGAVARLGGDEFVVIHTAAYRREEVTNLAERLVASIGQPMVVNGHQLTVGVSIGIAFAPAGDADVDRLLKSADLALYRAKADGRNTYRCFEADMDLVAEERHRLELDLREALARNEFEVHYQPAMHVVSGHVTGFEALVRWRHPVRGLVSPGDFITVSEETGLIVPIGRWVLRAACAEAASWPTSLRLAVNISAVQFRYSDILGEVVAALEAAELAPDRLELEITESVLMHESAAVVETLHKLRALGVHIALDDFGTGFSSLRYLRRFPFDKIKIDQCFTRDLTESHEALAIVRAIIGLGSDLGVTTTAEGVETDEQMRALAAEGCQEVQGYLLSRPMPARAIPGILASLNAAMRSAA